MEIVLSGRHIDAAQAREYGFVNVVAEKKHFRQIANDLAAEIAARAPIAARLAKRAILAAEREGLDQGLETERRLFAEAMATEDRVEGVTAFLEGRKPRFEGNVSAIRPPAARSGARRGSAAGRPGSTEPELLVEQEHPVGDREDRREVGDEEGAGRADRGDQLVEDHEGDAGAEDAQGRDRGDRARARAPRRAG